MSTASEVRTPDIGRNSTEGDSTGRDSTGRGPAEKDSTGRNSTGRNPTRPDSSAEATRPSWAADPYSDALRTGHGPLFLRRGDGWLLPLDVERWCARADAVDRELLDRCEGAVLDVGCGPGRLVAELAARGEAALGIDVSEAAVAHTVGLGGQALLRSVFAPLPGEGRWGTALLADGNLGIGGDPTALLRRLAQLLTPGGLLIAETALVDIDERATVRLVGPLAGSGPEPEPVPTPTPSTPFPWARLGTPALLRYARPLGWRPVDQWAAGDRRFVALRSRSDRSDRPTHSSAEPPKSTAVISSQRARNPSPDSAVDDV
ncbi:class I SAM-dependent methyltransferase [Streptomyces sp. NPDC059009]|uniref:class I SAM-dependent methyltransferase n=1 Tax=Streptomyces sp. NPDC059009 TaxID=3346694 RepID=UPI003693EDBC